MIVKDNSDNWDQTCSFTEFNGQLNYIYIFFSFLLTHSTNLSNSIIVVTSTYQTNTAVTFIMVHVSMWFYVFVNTVGKCVNNRFVTFYVQIILSYVYLQVILSNTHVYYSLKPSHDSPVRMTLASGVRSTSCTIFWTRSATIKILDHVNMVKHVTGHMQVNIGHLCNIELNLSF